MVPCALSGAFVNFRRLKPLDSLSSRGICYVSLFITKGFASNANTSDELACVWMNSVINFTVHRQLEKYGE